MDIRGYGWQVESVAKKHWLWRAVDQHGHSLEILVQSRRNTKAAKRFMRKLMKQYGMPRVIITDKLRSYGAANVIWLQAWNIEVTKA